MYSDMAALRVENISKEFKLYKKPSDRLFEAILKKKRHTVKKAVEDISFTLEPGDSLGIIGDNGAGKSTLLKILVGTLTPSRGIIETHGRVAALLELGAGFHPEFTGRQNIVLNASLMGMTTREIAEKEDEIIEFAELGEYIDMPVKTYSSGMYVRLGFSIATSVDPDILVIDEALAVGDMKFQRKCIERMGRFRDRGKTMLFCSHSMYHVGELCRRALWIKDGGIYRSGPSARVIEEYEQFSKNGVVDGLEAGANNCANPAEVSENSDCRILDLKLTTLDGKETDLISPLSSYILSMDVEILKNGLFPQFGFAFVLPDETIFATALTHHDGVELKEYGAGQRVNVSLRIDDIPFRVGKYRITGGVADEKGMLWYEAKHLWPIRVVANKGMGQVVLKKKWKIMEFA
jgi:ABC-type polysaccharide/polyol phosphate transport system ATPase subunit